MSIDKKRVRFYAWVGVAYFLLRTLSQTSSEEEGFFVLLLNNIWYAFYLVVLNFILFEIAIPHLKMDLRGAVKALLLFFAFMISYSFGLYVWQATGSKLGMVPAEFVAENEVTDYMATGLGSIFFFGIIRHIYNYKNLKVTTQQLRIEKQQAELYYLKSQTNPHFLFNTLNNIYSLAREKSDLTAESVMRLSKILRFMLYETNGDYISVEQEIKVISDYIALEKLRYDDSLSVNYHHDIEDMKQAVPPLLLVPLVENAFKHGISETRIKPFLDVHLSIKNRLLELVVKNSIPPASIQENIKENIGLKNLRRQLELLYNQHDLKLQQDQSTFTAVLKINLADHV